MFKRSMVFMSVLAAALFAGAALLLVRAETTAAGRIPATALLRDAYVIDAQGAFAGWSDRVRSDSLAPGVEVAYADGDDCVAAWIQSSQFFLRTVRSNCSPYSRSLVLDFSEPTAVPASCVVADAAGHGELDICRENLVADVRLIASNLFARSALLNGSPASFYFSLAPDFRSTAFELTYQLNLAVSETSIARVLTASSQVANLYQLSGKKRVLLGTYRMPFEVKVVPAS